MVDGVNLVQTPCAECRASQFAVRSNLASSPNGPMSCTPTGIPPIFRSGRLMAGTPQ
jgi:hypothetical protein